MKKRILLVALAVTGVIFSARAQHISIRLDFPAGSHFHSYGPAPYRGATWIGPEWQWRHGRYVAVPGYWAQPVRPRAVWIAGHWDYSRRGYTWIPGHWRY
jgi:hypothetical protein